MSLQFECCLPACALHIFKAITEERTNWLSLLQNNNAVICICDTEVVGVNERLGQQRGRGGDMAEGAQFSKSTVFVYAP